MAEGGAAKNNETTSADSANEDCLLKHVDISLVESEKRTNGTLHLRDHYTVYLLEMKVTDPDFADKIARLSAVWRRYTEFEQLREYLQITYPYVVIPPLPEKKVLYGWNKVSSDTFDPDFIDRRRAGLETFLLRVASHHVLSRDKHFVQFLQQEDAWRESCKSQGYVQAMENKLKVLGVVVRLRKTDPRFQAIRDYSCHLQTSLHALLRARSRVAERQYTIYKLHSNYGRVFSEWSVVENDMGDALQRIGHYMDSLASSVDATLEDEELLADQLKEYLFFAGALQDVCRHKEILQLELENAEGTVASKSQERSKAQQGKLGLMSRLFGAVDTEEVRELRVNLLDKQIRDGNETVTNTRGELEEFCDKALEDIERFQKQKVEDLRETLAAYTLLQLKTAKKGLQTWMQIRDCLQSIP